MDNSREIDQVLMNINRTSGGIVSAALFSTALTFKLVTYLMRMAKKGLAASGLVDAFKNFNQKTSGQFTVYNIPLSQEKAQKMNTLNKLNLELDKEKNPIKAASLRSDIKKLEKEIPELAQLKMLGIEHCVLPKLNGSNQTIQVGVANVDDQKFKNWYLNHLTTELKGGQKNLEAIKVFTEGNYTILNMPFEEVEELGVMFSDFNTMGINYAVCPDLNVGDGYTQVAIPNANRGLVEDWFKLYKEKALSEGKEITKDIYAMDGNSYAATGAVSAEQYINSSDELCQAANAEFEMESWPVPWTQKMKHENSPEFVKLMQDNNYQKITINKETLVEEGLDKTNLSFLMETAEKRNYFVSRVPQTWGAKQEALVLPMSQVFTTDEDKTFIAFLHKGENCMIADAQGNISKRSFADTYKPYDVVTRGFGKVQELKQGMDLQKTASLTKGVAASVPVPNMLPKA